MKKLLLAAFIVSILGACGTSQQTSNINVRSGRSIQSTFFGSRFGDSRDAVQSKDPVSYRGLAPKNYLAPLGKRKIKSELYRWDSAFGGYKWLSIVNLFDFKDRFFGIAFVHETGVFDEVYTRYTEIKNTLDKKYGPGEVSEDGVHYYDSYGRGIVLAVMESDRENVQRWFCGLYYLDEKLYQKDTEVATDEL